jgi:hypothetical protein
MTERGITNLHVPLIPAQAGIQGNKRWSLWPWVPAFAGTSGDKERFHRIETFTWLAQRLL